MTKLVSPEQFEVMATRTIVSEFSVGKYKVLKLDDEEPQTKYTKYIIDGKAYDVVPIYDLPNCIAIESLEEFTGKTVIFA